jgi:hypothetical protein
MYIKETMNVLDTTNKNEFLKCDSYATIEDFTKIKEPDYSFVRVFRELQNTSKKEARNWFWTNVNFLKHSIYIGNFNKLSDLPESDEDLTMLVKKLIKELKDMSLDKIIHIKFYICRKDKSKKPLITYFLVCDQKKLPVEYLNSLTNIISEKYPVNKEDILMFNHVEPLINCYLEYNSHFEDFHLINEMSL